MKTIKLNKNQYKLLIECLSAHAEELSNAGCNDIHDDDLERYSNKELQEILESNGKSNAKEVYKEWLDEKKQENVRGSWSDALKNGWGMFSDFPVRWLIEAIKKQR